MFLRCGRYAFTNHTIEDNYIDYHSASGKEILLPYNAPNLYNDALPILCELVSYDPKNGIDYNPADMPEMIESAQFYIKLNVQEIGIQERYRRGTTTLTPCRLMVYVDIKTRWSNTPTRYQIGTDNTQDEADAIAAKFQGKQRPGLDPVVRRTYYRWIKSWLSGGQLDEAAA